MGAQIVFNPIIIGCACGMAFSASGLVLPKTLNQTLHGLSDATLPLALLIVGASLQRRVPEGNRIGLVGLVCFLKLVFLPGIIFFLLKQGPVPDTSLLMAVVLLGAPNAVTSHIMAKEMLGDDALAARLLMATIILAPFTLTGWISLLS